MAEQRLYGLDFCRATLMLLGLLFHCGLIYGSGQDWRVLSEQTNGLISLLSNFIHHFRMEAFYLVAGFFYLLLMQKGRRDFLRSRLMRAAIPMTVIGITLNPIMNLLSENWQYQWDWGYLVDGRWLGHLWFLGNLLVYFVLTKPICNRLLQHQIELSKPQWYCSIAGLVAFSFLGHLAADVFALKTWIFINFGYLPYYLSYFLLGVLACLQRDKFFDLINVSFFPIYLGAYVLLQGISRLSVGVVEGWTDAHAEWLELASHFPLMLAALAILNFIGLRDLAFIRTLSNASYTIYLLHQPLIIIFYVTLFEGLALGAIAEYVLLVAVVFSVSLLAHNLVVDRFQLARYLLNGVKQ